MINIPTRLTQTSENRHEILPVVSDYAITDHYPVMAIIGKTFTTKNAPPYFARSFSHFNQDDYWLATRA